MITDLSPGLKSHIEKYIEEIDRGDMFLSVVNCPLDILVKYIQVLKTIEYDLNKSEQTYFNIASWIYAYTENACCRAVDVTDTHIEYIFEMPLQDVHHSELRDALCACDPFNEIQFQITTDAQYLKTIIQVITFQKFKFTKEII